MVWYAALFDFSRPPDNKRYTQSAFVEIAFVAADEKDGVFIYFQFLEKLESTISTIAAYICASCFPCWFLASQTLSLHFSQAESSFGIPHCPCGGFITEICRRQRFTKALTVVCQCSDQSGDIIRRRIDPDIHILRHTGRPVQSHCQTVDQQDLIGGIAF